MKIFREIEKKRKSEQRLKVRNKNDTDKRIADHLNSDAVRRVRTV